MTEIQIILLDKISQAEREHCYGKYHTEQGKAIAKMLEELTKQVLYWWQDEWKDEDYAPITLHGLACLMYCSEVMNAPIGDYMEDWCGEDWCNDEYRACNKRSSEAKKLLDIIEPSNA
jgi:hypothetical protein